MAPGYRRIATVLAALTLTALAATLPAAQPERSRVEADQRALVERIQRLQRQLQQDTVEKNRRTRDLRDAERTEARAREELTRLRAERAERTAARRHLASERAEREADQARTEADLARQLRAAYFMGRNEPLKLLLNQRSPAEFSRNLAYYGYLGRLRADQIKEIGENIARIEELTASIEAEEARLAGLEQRQQAQVAELEAARKRRSQALVSLERESTSRAASLQRAQREKQELDRLLEQLRRATESLPYDPNAPFAQTRGRLNWPVAGRISINYNATVPGLGRSDSIEFDTDYGAPVRAIHEGRVEFADWTSTRGHLVIINHGNNRYLTVYGHLGELHVKEGARVSSGQSIGTAGDSGGRSRPGLYFQLRAAPRAGQASQPIDPRPWFRSATPPAG